MHSRHPGHYHHFMHYIMHQDIVLFFVMAVQLLCCIFLVVPYYLYNETETNLPRLVLMPLGQSIVWVKGFRIPCFKWLRISKSCETTLLQLISTLCKCITINYRGKSLMILFPDKICLALSLFQSSSWLQILEQSETSFLVLMTKHLLKLV